MRLRSGKNAGVETSTRERNAVDSSGGDQGDASLQLHPVPSRDALIVKVQPPKEPAKKIKHVASDIVLVIDISASMATPADVPGEDESTGLSVLDLVKHASMAIVETLGEGDRLGIVTFCSKSNVVQELSPMTDKNKDAARKNIQAIRPLDATNLWHGILDGIKVFKRGGPISRAPSIMLLTDGKPNHMNPEMGFVPKLRSMLPLPAPISTFGFGYTLQSGLLKSIAEIGGGNYAFIPDAGMIGTVFVHAVANLQTTFATNAVLGLQYAEPLELQEAMGETVGQQAPEADGPHRRLIISLGNLQYGHSRDIFLKVKNIPRADPFDEKEQATITASLVYDTPGNPVATTASTDLGDKVFAFGTGPVSTVRCSMLVDSDLAASEVSYHESRAQICAFLSHLFPIMPDGVHKAIDSVNIRKKVVELNALTSNLRSQKHSDTLNQSLMEDLAGNEPNGQVSLALKNSSYFTRWGIHYLPSLLNAHTRQACNSFKDPGPLQYGVDSPLFIACRDRLDLTFDNLPAPEPSLLLDRDPGAPGGSKVVSMSKYRNPYGVCFAGSTPVELASGKKVAIRKLRRGMKVRTPAGPRRVAAVLKTAVEEEMLCRVGDVLVTSWHPISGDAKAWGFPASISKMAVLYTGFIYSIMLQRDGDSKAHGIRIGGFWGVTLGHGFVRGNDARAHEFFGDFNRVAKALMGLGMGKNGVALGRGVDRDEKTGLVVGFRRGAVDGGRKGFFYA